MTYLENQTVENLSIVAHDLRKYEVLLMMATRWKGSINLVEFFLVVVSLSYFERRSSLLVGAAKNQGSVGSKKLA